MELNYNAGQRWEYKYAIQPIQQFSEQEPTKSEGNGDHACTDQQTGSTIQLWPSQPARDPATRSGRPGRPP